MGPVIPIAMAAVSALGSAGAAIGSTVAAAGATAAGASGLSSSLIMASTALSAGGALYGGIAANQAGKYQAKVLNMQAEVAERNRGNALIAGSEKESRLKMAIARTIGSQRAAMAANGVDVDVGSAVDIADSTRLEGEADLATLHYQALQEAYAYSQEAWSNRANAKMAKAEGKQALFKGILGAGATVLGGATALGKNAAAAKRLGIGSSNGAARATYNSQAWTMGA